MVTLKIKGYPAGLINTVPHNPSYFSHTDLLPLEAITASKQITVTFTALSIRSICVKVHLIVNRSNNLAPTACFYFVLLAGLS